MLLYMNTQLLYIADERKEQACAVLQYGDREARELWPGLQRRIPSFFAGITVEPVLLHGDLWSGNVGGTDGGPGK